MLQRMKYVIIGAVAGGASAAARLRRLDEKAEIVIFEKGEYISYANCGLPYYIGNVIKDRNKLFVQTAAAFNQRFNIDVRVQTEVLSIDPKAKTIEARDQKTGLVYSENYDKLILSPGAEPVKPPLPGIMSEGIFTLRNVNDTDYIKAYANMNKSGKAVVIGGGFIGLEMAENLHLLGMEVSIIEMGEQILAPVDFTIAAIVQQHIRKKGIDLRLNTSVVGFEKNKTGISVSIKDSEPIEADLVILSIGVRPDTRLAVGAGLNLGTAKGIWVNEYLQTSDPDIYAVGDAIEFSNPITGNSMSTFLAGPANKQGRICANNIVLGNTEKYNGAINTAIVKVFDMTIATAGMPSKQLKKSNISHVISTTHSGSHAGYYPGAAQMTIQLAFSSESGKLYGAQVVGYEGADKRIEMLSSVIKRGSTIFELAEIEHAYAPPYSSAKDPVNIAGFVAENMLLKKMNVVYWNESGLEDQQEFIIDVRTLLEFKSGHIPGAKNLPLDALRERIDEIPPDRKIIVYCAVGQRGYLAQRILIQKGYENIFNLSGGYQTWKHAMAETEQVFMKKKEAESNKLVLA